MALSLVGMLAGCGSYSGARLGSAAAPTASTATTSPTGPTARAAPEVDVEPAGQPKVGECRNYGMDAVAPGTNDDPVVDCAGEHTAYTFYVGRLATMADAGRQARRECSRAFRKEVGGISSAEFERTVAFYAYFMPSGSGWDAGERWLRCDLVAGVSELLPLPEDHHDLADHTGPGEEFALCLQVSGVVFVSCQEPHDFTYVSSFTLTDKFKPNDRELRRRSVRACARQLDHQDWYATWPSFPSWRNGDRWLRCWELADPGA